MKKLIFAIVVLVSFSHCTKFGKNISVEGRLVNHLKGEGLSGVEMRIVRNTSTTYEGGGKEVKSATTDENGYFRMDRLGVIETHSVQIKSFIETYDLGWYSESGELLTKSGLLTLKKGKTTRANYHVLPYGSYRININNVNCQGANDTIIISRTNFAESLSGANWVLTGCSGYLTSFNEQTPMGPIYTNYTVIRNGVSTSFYQEFLVQPNQENTQVINY